MRDILNKKFGKLTVKSILSYYKDSRGVDKRIVKCICDCGEEVEVKDVILNFQDKASCGCVVKTDNSTHGKSTERIYKIWVDIKTRCYNKNSTYFNHYGGRGVGMCERWRESFENFYEDMGDIPSEKHSIERLDVNKGYTLDNCEWVTKEVQARNRRKRRDNKTGCNGVSQEIIDGKLTRYRVEWYDLEKKKKSKSFSILKYGKEEAFRLACEARENAIKELNEQGAGYSENHGK